MNETNPTDVELSEEEDLSSENALPGVIALLGELKPGAVITEEGVARLFGRHATSVKRAVQRGELPPPCRLFGKRLDCRRTDQAHREPIGGSSQGSGTDGEETPPTLPLTL